jgi:hypothetical protein
MTNKIVTLTEYILLLSRLTKMVECCNVGSHHAAKWNDIMLRVILLSVAMLCAFMLSVAMLFIIMLFV